MLDAEGVRADPGEAITVPRVPPQGRVSRPDG